MIDNKKNDVIDLRVVISLLLQRKKLFVKVLIVTFVIASALILCVPRTYTCTVKLAPEAASATTGSALGSIASSLGFDLSNMESNDAIFPLLYPELFESNDFLVQLFDIKIKSLDGEIKTSYYDYLEKHQKKAIWKIPFTWLISKINNIMSPPVDVVGGGNQGERYSKSFILSRKQVRIVEKMKDLIVCNIDKKTNVISIVVTDQDPLISATIADSVRMKLQQFIIDYRTEKARVDVDHYQQLLDNAKQEYELALAKYSEYSDTHKDIILQAYISERDKLENDMSLKYQTYTAMKAQLEAAKSKLQEKVPAFTVLQGASVPIKPTGPKRMIFVIGMLFLSVIVTSLVVLKGQIADMFKI
jgi:uncharacterized protein involved in exopolysaccharide biosynthesis